MYVAAYRKTKDKYRDPSPFDYAQGQDDGFKRTELGTSISDLLDIVECGE